MPERRKQGGITLRPATPDDAATCGRICHDAFAAIAAQHNFPKSYPSVEFAVRDADARLSNPGFYGVVAELDGRIIGSNYLDERSPICGVGPITVDPAVQDAGTGRLLMQAVMDRAATRRAPGVRLVQDAYHNRSFVLYTKLGFQMRVTTSVLQGPPFTVEIPGCTVRPAQQDDVDACNAGCLRVHGHHRGGEVEDAIKDGVALVVHREGRVTGYTTTLGFRGHSVAETNDDLKALIGAGQEFQASGILVPNSNDALLRWCYGWGMQMVKAMTLMTVGLYNEPNGPYLPSAMF